MFKKPGLDDEVATKGYEQCSCKRMNMVTNSIQAFKWFLIGTKGSNVCQ